MIEIIQQTATGKEQALVDFYGQLKRDAAARPRVFAGDVTSLARQARVGRCHLSRLLSNGSIGRQSGRDTWKHVVPHLSIDALCVLARCSAWNTHVADAVREHARECFFSPTNP